MVLTSLILMSTFIALCFCLGHDRVILVLVEVFAVDRISRQEYEQIHTFTLLLHTMYNVLRVLH